MNLEKAMRLYQYCQSHPEVKRLYDEGDARRAGQTKHGFLEHALPVVRESCVIADTIRAHNPSLIDDYTYHVVLPFGALLHDIGGANSIEHHDVEGVKLMQPFLAELTLPGDTETLSAATQRRILKIIACHRAGKYLKMTTPDAALDIVLLADKSVGDEDRVRPARARLLRTLTQWGLAGLPLTNNGAHDRINFAIESSKLVTEGGDMLLRLKVKDDVLRDSPWLFWLPTRPSIYSVIFDHPYYKKNFHSMERAAGHLGFPFYLEFNGVRFGFAKETKTWSPAKS